LDSYGWTVACATAGAYWAVTGAETATRGQAAAAMVRWVLVSVIFSELAVALAAKHVGVNAELVQGPVAFLLAFWGDRWREIPGLVSRAVARLLPGRKQP
jgi:hypothetical protein